MEYTITKKRYTDNDEYLVSIDVVETEFEDFKATIKWDGCIDMVLDLNSPTEKSVHICDINVMIERLETLKRIANEHFIEWY